MAATERPASRILAATLLLPGLASVSGMARAEEPPTDTIVGFKYGWYRDWQPDWGRVGVKSPHAYLLAPFAGQWSFEATIVADAISGATPRMHTFRTGATPYMSDQRDAGEVKVTRYFHRAAVAFGRAYSKENDYLSRSMSVEARVATEDNNTTFNAGFAETRDHIDTTATGGFATDEHKHVREATAGVTQVLTANDIAQVQFTRSVGTGYYSDPYKDFDNRPRTRRATIALARWNHHIETKDATLRASWRYYNDSFGIRSHTLGVEWVQALGAFTITPGLRYYRQSAAWFYFDPQLSPATGEPASLATRIFFGGIPGFKSADQRLAAYGAFTASLKVAYDFTPRDTADVKFDAYRQAAHMRFGGGSPYLAPFRATFIQAGWQHKF